MRVTETERDMALYVREHNLHGVVIDLYADEGDMSLGDLVQRAYDVMTLGPSEYRRKYIDDCTDYDLRRTEEHIESRLRDAWRSDVVRQCYEIAERIVKEEDYSLVDELCSLARSYRGDVEIYICEDDDHITVEDERFDY